MKWSEIAKRYAVHHEHDGRKVSLRRIEIEEARGGDWEFEIRTKKGVFYKHSETMFGVIALPTKNAAKRASLWRKFNDRGFRQVQVGDTEGSWIFGPNEVDFTLTAIGARKRKKTFGISRPFGSAVMVLAGLLGSCAAKGPYTMKRERVDGLMTRYENSEIVCYVSHGIEADDLTCKWKSESDANIRARKLIAQDLR